MLEPVLVWIVCSIIGFWIAQNNVRRDSDFEVGDAIFFGLLSLLGPIFLMVAVIFWLGGLFLRSGIASIVLLPRKPRQ